jgi:hypothetical protein
VSVVAVLLRPWVVAVARRRVENRALAISLTVNVSWKL